MARKSSKLKNKVIVLAVADIDVKNIPLSKPINL